MRLILLTIPFVGLSALIGCGGPSSDVWVCAGQSDLVVTTDGPDMTIFAINDETSVELTEVDEEVRWVASDREWQIVGLDQALYTVEGRSSVCRRPG